MKKSLLVWVGVLLVMATTFAYYPSQSDEISLQRIFDKIDFIYEEDPAKIQEMILNIPRTQEKYKNQERLIYALEEISRHLHITMKRKKIEDTQKMNSSKTFELDTSNILHLRNQNLNQSDMFSIADMLKQLKDQKEAIISISFSYNKNIGDVGITLLMQNMPLNVWELGCVWCGISDDGARAVLEWMKQSQNLQMICIEQNNFSDDIQEQFRDFKKENPHIIVIF